jgi:hypothetical protein
MHNATPAGRTDSAWDSMMITHDADDQATPLANWQHKQQQQQQRRRRR